MGERNSTVRSTVMACRVAGLVLPLLVAACAGGSGSGSGLGPDSRAPSPTLAGSPAASAGDAARRAAVATYTEMWQAMGRAGATSDWQSPELARYAMGEALATITRSLYADHVHRMVTRGAPTNFPVVRAAEPPDDPTTVRLDDCGDSSHWLKYVESTNTPAGDGSGGGRRFITAEVLRQTDGSWRVSRFAVQGLGTC